MDPVVTTATVTPSITIVSIRQRWYAEGCK